MSEILDPQFDEMLNARHIELETKEDLEAQRGTPIPALFNVFYKFIQNPSSVSVETYKRMIDTDDTLGSGVDFLTTCLAARLGQYEHPSEEITKFINKALTNVEGGWYNAIKELLSASWCGFSVQEQVWENHNDGFLIKKMVSLPPQTILFETERTGELTSDGILQYQRYSSPLGLGTPFFSGWSSAGSSNFGFSGFRPDMFAKFGDMPYPIRQANSFQYLSIRIPVDKCVHYSFDAQGKFGNPYGRSLLRRAYKYYVMKDAFLQMLAIALDRKGTPLLVVFTDPNTTLRDPSKAGDSNIKGQSGQSIRADQAALNAFKNIHNDSVVVLPGKKDQTFSVDPIAMGANQDAFIQALDFCNKSMLRALLIPSLIFGNGDGTGSFALGQEHAKTFEKILDGWLKGLEVVLCQQVVKRLLAYNFPKSAWEKDGLGSFSKREFNSDEADKMMTMYATGIDKGIIDATDLMDLNKMRDTMGFEPKTDVPEATEEITDANDDDGDGKNPSDKEDSNE